MKRLLLLLPLMIVLSCQGRASSNRESEEVQTLQQHEFVATSNDSLFFDEAMKEVLVPTDSIVPLNERIMAFAKTFMGTPYVAATLETESDEQLIVNLREVDCTTFVEYVLAMAQVSQQNGADFGQLAFALQNWRYKNGVVDGYTSRLHYFTDWLKNHERKGWLTLISNSIGNATMDMGLDFMSAHPAFYAQLDNNPALVEKIRLVEQDLAAQKMAYITKDRISENEHGIRDGDIIAFVTTIDGLDVSHTGFAFFKEGRLHLLHASTRTNQVEITPVPLNQYLQKMGTVSGILVARPHF